MRTFPIEFTKIFLFLALYPVALLAAGDASSGTLVNALYKGQVVVCEDERYKMTFDTGPDRARYEDAGRVLVQSKPFGRESFTEASEALTLWRSSQSSQVEFSRNGEVIAYLRDERSDYYQEVTQFGWANINGGRTSILVQPCRVESKRRARR